MSKFVLFFTLILFNNTFSQDKCVNFSEIKYKNQIKTHYGVTYFYGDFYFKSFGVEFLRENKINVKSKFNFLYGLSYFYRPLVENRSNPYNKIDVASFIGSIDFIHHYIELPLLLSTTNKKKTLYFGIAPVLLIYGTLDFGNPDYIVKYNLGKISYLNKIIEIDSYNDFFSPFNLKVQIGYSYALAKSVKTGINLNSYVIPIGKNYNCESFKCEKRKPFLITNSIYLSIHF